MNKAETILQLQNLDTGYGTEKKVLTGLNFSFATGLTGIIGVNGIGKSTLLKTIAGFLNPLSGKILLNEKDLAQMDYQDRAKFIAVVLTEKIADPYLSVEEVIASGRSPYSGFLGTLNSKDQEVIEKYISLCGIESLRTKKMSEISDGERQRCMIARALAQETPVILLDEPTSYLDFKARFGIIQLLKEISEKENKIILFSSHDIELVFRSANNCIVMLNKNEIFHSTCKEIINSELPEKLLEGSNLIFDRNNYSISFK